MTALDSLSADLKHHALSNGIEIKKRYLVSTTAAAAAPASSTNSVDASVQSQKQSPLQYRTSSDSRNVANESKLIQKPSSSSSSSSSINSKSTFASIFIYPYLLELILFVLTLVQLVRLFAFRVYYFVSQWMDATGIKPSKLISAPSHVCVILNETVTESSSVNDLVERFSLIVDVMSAHGTRLVSFYAYQPLDTELTQKLLRICSKKSDPNNNGLFENLKSSKFHQIRFN